MPVPEKLKAPFEADAHYHVVFKSIDDLLLFQAPEDRDVFMERFEKFNHLILDTWTYSLLDNHVHLIIKAKSLNVILENIADEDESNRTVSMKNLVLNPEDVKTLDAVFERQINSFMVSFARYNSDKYLHSGGLFQKPFKRVRIDTESWLQQAIIYVHANCVKHRIFADYKTYPYSSFSAFADNTENMLLKEVMDFFGGAEQFYRAHELQIAYFYQKGFPNSKLE